MTEIPHTRAKNALTQTAFDGLLSALDAEDRDAAGEKYILLREHLRLFFNWRGCPAPEDHADETLNRAARRLEAGEIVNDFRAYVFGVARFLHHEIIREEEKTRRSLAEMGNQTAVDSSEEKLRREKRLDCLEKCLSAISDADRDLITAYYQGEQKLKIENRKKLLDSLNLKPSGLRMRALRLREKLEICLQNCLERIVAQNK